MSNDATIYDITTRRPLSEAAKVHAAHYRRADCKNTPPTAAERRQLLAVFDSPRPPQREFTWLFCQALRRDRTLSSPDSPDAEVIHHCERLRDLARALNAAFPAIEEDKLREIAMEPLDREWWDVVLQLFRQPPPTTREGVMAAAQMMLSYSAMDTYAEAVKGGHTLEWLSRAVAEYLAKDA